MKQEKNSKDEALMNNIDKAIQELVYEKTKFIKAYNYYNGKRDPEQYRHLEENYGIGTATSVEFVPLVRKHIDRLVGEYLSTPVLPKISCKDKSTLSNIFRDKQLEIINTVFRELQTHLQNTIYSAIKQSQQPKNDEAVQAEIERLIDDVDNNFISEYEIAGQNIIDWLMQSRNIDFVNKRKIMILDLLISGTCYYKVKPSPSNDSIDFRVLNPLNSFVDRNPHSPYLKDSYRSVIREYLTKHQILATYGKLLAKEDIEKLDALDNSAADVAPAYLRSYDRVQGEPYTDGILGGFEVTPILPYERTTSKYYRTFPVYEVEWLETEKEGEEWITYRYEGVRVSDGIYILIGKSKYIIRSQDSPSVCHLSLNGTFFSDRNGEPYSLVLATANLQDKFDVLMFYRDNLISQSGTTGSWVDLAYLPKVLGTKLPERLQKWLAYKKTGLAIVDSSQEGTPMTNTMFNGYDDTIKVQAIQAIQIAIQDIEKNCSDITGVFREQLAGIEQKDAVSNVQVGIRNSSYVTKQYYQIMDLMTREFLLDALNLSKIVFKNGITGTLVLGDKLRRIFTALPEHFTVTDYDVHIADSSDVIKEQTDIKQISMELLKGGILDPEVLISSFNSKSLTQMQNEILGNIGKKKKENDQVGKMSQQLEELQKQSQQLAKENEALQKQIEQLNQSKLTLEKEKLDKTLELDWFNAKSKDKHETTKNEIDQKRMQLEGAQLFDDNLQNNEIKND